MKIYLGKPRNHWISPYTILERVFFWRDISYEEPIIDKWANRLAPICTAWMRFLNFIHPEINYVKIDYWDTWSMDYTLSPIIAPMLKQLHATKHGAGFVDDADVPEGLGLRSTEAPPKENEWDTDDNHFKRYDWILEEMIWTFTALSDGDHESKFFDYSECSGDLKEICSGTSKLKIDREGLDAHNARIERGLRLFGKYYRTLWD